MDFDLDDPEQAAIVELRTRNAERLAQLAARGMAINVDRNSAVIEFLVDHLAGLSPERLAFERTWAEGIKAGLDDIDGQLRLATLTQGVAGVNVEQLNRQQRRAAERHRN